MIVWIDVRTVPEMRVAMVCLIVWTKRAIGLIGAWIERATGLIGAWIRRAIVWSDVMIGAKTSVQTSAKIVAMIAVKIGINAMIADVTNAMIGSIAVTTGVASKVAFGFRVATRN